MSPQSMHTSLSKYTDLNRPQGLCESEMWSGPRRGQPCVNRARFSRIKRYRRYDGPLGVRVCGVHARAYGPSSLVEIGSEGWTRA